MVEIAPKADRANNFHVNGVWRAHVGTTDYIYKMVQNFEYSIDETNQDEDYIDDGSAMFSRIGDKIGTFSFDLKKAVSLFDTAAAPTNQWLVSYWLRQIAANEPPELDFVETIYAPKTATGKFARVSLRLRIRSTTSRRDVARGVGDIPVSGEVIGYTSARRANS